MKILQYVIAACAIAWSHGAASHALGDGKASIEAYGKIVHLRVSIPWEMSSKFDLDKNGMISQSELERGGGAVEAQRLLRQVRLEAPGAGRLRRSSAEIETAGEHGPDGNDLVESRSVDFDAVFEFESDAAELSLDIDWVAAPGWNSGAISISASRMGVGNESGRFFSEAGVIAPGKPSARFFEGARASRGASPAISGSRWGSEALSMFKSGFFHIWEGADHLAFIAALAAGALAWRAAFWMASFFTLAHALTMGLSASGNASWASDRWVEPLIALSVAAAGFWNLRSDRVWGRSLSSGELASRCLMSFGFGLAHGLGFAGGFSAPAAQGWGFAISLGWFGLGLETAQGVALISFLVLFWSAQRWAMKGQGASRFVSWVAFFSGVFWFAERLLGF